MAIFPMAAWRARPVAVALGLSATLHGLLLAWTVWTPKPDTSAMPSFDGIDIQMVPAAPKAEAMPSAESPAPAPAAEPPKAADSERSSAADARPRRPRPDAALAQNLNDAAQTNGDAATGNANGTDAKDGAEDGADDVASASPGTLANLARYMPEGHVLTAMIRFDRLRATPWAAVAERLLAPTPDYQMIVGDKAVRFLDLFETIVISTSNPRDVLATTILGRARVPRSKLRELLTTPDTPVRWYAGRGGMIGERSAGARVHAMDQRVYVSPFSDWIMLAQRADVTAYLPPAAAPEIDKALTQIALPAWLTIEREAGNDKEGPALVLTFTQGPGLNTRGMNKALGSTPKPTRGSLTAQVDGGGFVIRGNLLFASEADAATFVAAALRRRDALLADLKSQLALTAAGAHNAMKNLSLRQSGKRVAYATSISGGDARSLFGLAESAVTGYFEALRR